MARPGHNRAPTANFVSAFSWAFREAEPARGRVATRHARPTHVAGSGVGELLSRRTMSNRDRGERGGSGEDDPDETPPTRRSSPLPTATSGLDLPIPRLRPLSIELHGVGEDAQSDVEPTELVSEAAISSVRPEVHATGPAPSVEQLERQIRDLEARLDGVIGSVASSGAVTAPRAPRASEPGIAGAPPSSTADRRAHAAPPASSAPTARELLSTDFYLRQWGRAGMRRRAEEVDELGYDPKYEDRFRPLLDFLYQHYFRVETEGAEGIPDEGPCLIVANHSGGPLPYDGLMLRTTVRREHPAHRELRWLAEDFVYHLPFVGTAMNRLGAVRACPENAERLLGSGRLVAVFPEGAKGIGKLYKDRYRLQRFGRGGFIRLCLRTGTPIIPCAIVGAEEANPTLFRVEYMAKTLGIPFLPITPTFPALGPLGLLPAPTKWRVTFGEPVRFEDHGAEAADDEVLVGRLAERVRATIQVMLDRTLGMRRSVWFG